jgi:nitrite reductase/ring-hydroxylating ferredoxin subunit
MIIRKLSVYFYLLLLIACSSGPADDPIPVASFADIVIDINLPAYIKLRTDGGYIDNIKQGIRGIIVYRVNAFSFQAYERNCSYHPNDACATVNVHSSGLYLTDPCCNSNFSFTDGSVTGGPAWQPLRRYRTQVNGTTLTISDEALN